MTTQPSQLCQSEGDRGGWSVGCSDVSWGAFLTARLHPRCTDAPHANMIVGLARNWFAFPNLGAPLTPMPQ
jgi:hypothetical protein